jgi:hypothetical protein
MRTNLEKRLAALEAKGGGVAGGVVVHFSDDETLHEAKTRCLGNEPWPSAPTVIEVRFI